MVGEPVRRLVHAREFCSIANTRGTRTCRLWVGPAKVWKRSPVKTTDAANCGDVVAHVLNYSVKVVFLVCAWFFVRPREMPVRGRRFLIGPLSQIAHPPRLTCHRRIFGTPQRRKQRRIAKLTQVQHTHQVLRTVGRVRPEVSVNGVTLFCTSKVVVQEFNDKSRGTRTLGCARGVRAHMFKFDVKPSASVGHKVSCAMHRTAGWIRRWRERALLVCKSLERVLS